MVRSIVEFALANPPGGSLTHSADVLKSSKHKLRNPRQVLDWIETAPRRRIACRRSSQTLAQSLQDI